MSKMINWGILGTSFISGVMADAIKAQGQSQIYAVAGRNTATLAEFATQYNIANQFTDFDALINDSLVDVIYIALPNHLHHEYVIKAANAGKAILCEKSLSVDMPSTIASLDAVKHNQVFFLEGLMYLAHPFMQQLSQTLASGVIGDVKSIRGQYCAAISQFVNPASLGALFNLGCYPASLMQLVMQQQFGNSVSQQYQLQATGRRGQDGNICESTAIVIYANGVQCHLHTAEDYGLHAGFTILGSLGSIEFTSNPWLPEAQGNHFSITLYEQDAQVVKVEAKGNGFYYQVEAVVAALESKQYTVPRPLAQLQDSHDIMSLLTTWHQAALKSCAENLTVKG
ncbi:Gfo/Idh/MocA family protein [Shewanella phaeophyticola]|uniref:Gfo/Idh/MocA family oxidoreductase n=1 Tax=Shewanella phaeophyticola TaxID=2978345 RepID=A0ABT2P5Y5_9GAMM|nr:Gfo/Idh/MocA family oxidoreductase [Shewanella sp. KJ10-1]MCT8986785.1 Gfo/Idh/MocA family oxidoreductase [Shewanella sp. KJ10-1]